MRKDIIKELQSDPNIYAECLCGGAFPLKKALLFYVEGPIPEKVKKIVAERENEIKTRRKGLIKERKKFGMRVEMATKSINLGKILEKVAPAVQGFQFNPRDCRGLFEPIDYVVFNGLTKNSGLVDSIYFIDVKTGRASLNTNQRRIRMAVDKGKVVWDQYRGTL